MKSINLLSTVIAVLVVSTTVPIISIMNHDIVLPAYAQDKAFAEPEEEENAGPYDIDSESKENYPNFNFVVAGDFGCGGKPERTISNMLTKDPELVLSTGDLSYSRTADCWFDVVSPLDKNGKINIAFGDHDIDKNLTRFNQYMDHFNLTQPYYSFNYQNVHFLAMATGKGTVIPYNETSKQYEFVEQDLSDANNNEEIDWIIVYSYRPLYSSPTNHPVLDSLQDAYHSLFDKYGVDLVLQGHNHNYQRTYPLTYNNTDPSTPVITDRHTRDYKNEKGAIFLTVGTGGKDLHNFTAQKPFVIEQFERHGFVNIDVTDGGRNLTSTFFENREMKDKDHFSIFKKSIR
jgi:hypothetical protein